MKKTLLLLVAFMATMFSASAQTELLTDGVITGFESWFGDAGWATINTSTAEWDGSKATVNINQEPYGQWHAQVKFHTTLTTLDPTKEYDFTCKINSNKEANGVTVKIMDNVEMYYNTNVALEAGDNDVKCLNFAGRADVSNGVIVFDFGNCANGTVLTISDLSLVEHEPTPADERIDWDCNSVLNLWKAVEDGSAFISVTPWFANNGWGQIADPVWNHADGAWTLTLPAEMGGGQWQGQFPINTTLTAEKGKKYDFYCVLESDVNLNGVTIKLTETDEDGVKHDGNFFFADRHNSKNGKIVYRAEGVQLTQNDAHALSLFFDFGGSPVGANVTISNIYFAEQPGEAPCDYYLPGTCKGWNFNDDTKFTYVGSNTWKIAYDEFNADFKVVKNGQWGADNEYAGVTNITVDKEYTLVKGGGNSALTSGLVVRNAVITLKVAEDGTHTLMITGDAKEEHTYGLVGDFQGWNAGNAPLLEEQADGSWTIDVTDFPGGKGFKVSIDKSWTCFCPGSKADGNKTMEFGVPAQCQRVDGADFNIGVSGEKYNVHVVLVVAADAQTATLTITDKATGMTMLQTTVDAEAIYNLAGQRLAQPQKGINIINGKKVMVK